MSAIGLKRTSLAAPHMSAFGGKAEAYSTSPSQESERRIDRSYCALGSMDRRQLKRISLSSTKQTSPGEHLWPSPASSNACASSGLEASTHHSSARVTSMVA